MKVNVCTNVQTHEGGRAFQASPYETLKRTVLACMLYEARFYESGKEATERIEELCVQCSYDQIVHVLHDAALKYHLRHVPLFLIVQLLKKKEKVGLANIIRDVITRPDMMTDLLALYWKNGRKPLPYQLKKGLAMAFTKFDAYQLGKYNRDNPVKLRDVLFLTHAKPKDEEQAETWKKLVDGTLDSPITWEVKLSSGQDKKETFSELLFKGKMGKLAVLRNMRNMKESGIPKEAVAYELMRNPKEMLPFQYIAAARECPQWEDIIDPAMIAACALKPKIAGKTAVLVDVSGSMDGTISSKSKMTLMDAACGMAILLAECLDQVIFISFSNEARIVPPRRGMALRDAIVGSQLHAGTYLNGALRSLDFRNTERVIVITDEQVRDDIPAIPVSKCYILNIAGYQNGIGYHRNWMTITGFSEASIDYIRELEQLQE